MIYIITGHYGAGKTNFSINLALHLAKAGENVSVADLDIVNPFFRTADFGSLFRENNIELLSSKYAVSNLDIPSLTFDLTEPVSNGRTLIVDVGGDDEGAKALGRYKNTIGTMPYEMIFVANFRRYLTQTAEQSLQIMREIEAASGFKITSIFNNTNLGEETTPETLEKSKAEAVKLSLISGLPLIYKNMEIDVFVKTPFYNK
ncbi:MAG: cobalamin biosynthesis protein CobQ [Ruminococcus sp.]|nr:cobalamin biosynthesis protein CobQ [Ruminococcus sp.]